MRCTIPIIALLALAGCAPPDEAPAEAAVRLTADPGPPPLESPPPRTLWRVGSDGWRAEDRVLAASADGRVRIGLDRRLRVDGRVVAEHGLPPLALMPDGAVVFTRQPVQPARDLWRVEPDGALRRLTDDGGSDRPVATPDGRLLHVSSVNGRARWMLDGAPLAVEAPPPAYADRHRWRDGRLEYDAGDARWWLDPQTGAAGRL